MRMMKGIFFFVVAFVVACVIILTFMQPPFHVAVGAKLLWYQTPPVPVFYYLAGAFAAGLLFGFVVFIYYYTQQGLELRETQREVRDKEVEAESLTGLLRQANVEIEALQSAQSASTAVKGLAS